MAEPVTIVGGGMSGLAAAWAAEQAGRQWRLLEATPRFGGKVRSERIDDWLLEWGPESFLVRKPQGLDLCRELGLDDTFLPCGPESRVCIRRQGQLVPIPGGARLFIPTDPERFRENELLSPEGTTRALAEIDLPSSPPAGDESVGAFVERRFGAEVLQRLAGPVLGGIYGANPNDLSLQASFPGFARMEREHGSLMRAMRNRPIGEGAAFTTLRPGMQALIDALVERLEAGDRGELVRDCPVDELPDGPVVLAVPAAAAAGLLAPRDPELADRLRELRTVSTATVNLAYRRDEIPVPDGFGFMSALGEPGRLVGCTWVTNKYPGRSPDDGFLVRAFVGGQQGEDIVDWPDADIVAAVRAELAPLAGIEAEPLFTRVAHWPQGNPQYAVGHLGRLAAIRERLADRHPDLRLVGSPYGGVGLSDCIREARALFS